ncbi:putative isopropanol dehydrogenase [Hypoxylon sp. FL0543]|nr:putative isopropanol dehydrogenase [Hypoxylon sp. FL0543]
MKALVLYGPGDLRLKQVPKPTAPPGSVVVSVIAAPIWDYVSQVIDGSSGEVSFPHAYPQIFGTCCIGRVDETGPDVSSVEPGQLVFCDHIVYLRDAPEKRFVLGYHGGHLPQELRVSSGHWKDGCFAEFARFPAENVHIVDEQLIAKRGIVEPARLGEISGIMSAIGAANAINIRVGETVLVLPATSFFSSSAVVAALGLGANVVAVDWSESNLAALIEHFGEDGKRITPVVLTGDIQKDYSALRAATPSGLGADAYMDFSSPEMAGGTHIHAGLLALKRFGRCCFAGMVPENVPLPYGVIRANCLTLLGSFAQNRRDVALTIRLIEAGNINLRKKITGKFSLEEVGDAMKLANEARGWENMVIIAP